MPNYLAQFTTQHLSELQARATAKELIALNDTIRDHGITLSASDCRELAEFRHDVLRECDRVETALGATERIIREFADSGYVDQQNFKQIVEDLVECFYTLKNETEDKASDDQVMEFLHYLFETVVGGDTSRLYNTQELDEFVSSHRGDLRHTDRSEQFSDDTDVRHEDTTQG